jgi:endogenous inhibitor of DNA gyrase (YacG/DUF329 family)
LKRASPTRFVSCPRCGAQVAWVAENAYRPFCSERCKLLDQGDWAMERFRVPVEEANDAPDAKGED